MSENFQILFVLGIQVSVLAILAVVLSRRLSPATQASRWLACSALAVIAILTCLAFLPTPDLKHHITQLYDSADTDALAASDTSNSLAETAPDENLQNDGATMRGQGLDLVRLAAAVGNVVERMEVQPPARVLPWLVSAIGLLLTLGVLRFVVALLHSRRIRQNSSEIRSPTVRATAKGIAEALGQQGFECRESPVISGAAVVGVFRPCVVLPPQWKSWSSCELNAVLAHEAAHLVNRDSLWRLLACVIETIHFYNPLVRLLTKQLAFAQEAAADRLASAIVGNKSYVRSLSSLALSHDATTNIHSAGMNPVFSGFLIRRIEMLRTLPNRSHTEWWASKFVVVGAMVTFGCLGYVARTFASPQEGGQQVNSQSDEPAARIASRKTSASSKPQPLAGMFNRERTDPNEVPENEEGFLKIRFNDLYKNFETGALRALANPAIATELKDAFESPELPKFDVHRIDTLLATCQLGFRYDETQEENKNSITLGMDAAEFRLNGAVDLAGWLNAYVPAAKEVDGEGVRKFELPKIAGLGPFPIPVAQKGDSSICFGGFMARRGGLDYSPEMQLDGVLNHTESENTSAWANAFRRIDGGIVAVVATNTWIDHVPEVIDDTLPEEEKKFQTAYRQLQNSIETISFGADVSADGNTIGVRIEIACDDAAKAKLVEQAIATLFECGLAHNSELDHSEIGPQIGKQFLSRSTVRQARYGDEFTVMIETTIDNPKFSGASLASYLAAEFN